MPSQRRNLSYPTFNRTNTFTAETDSGPIRLDKSLVFDADLRADECTDDGQSLTQDLTQDQLEALLRIEGLLEDLPPPILPIVAQEMREVIEHELKLWFLSRQPSLHDHGRVVIGKFAE